MGLADPALPENVRNIRASLDRQIPPDVRERTLFYHLRGGIRYDRLSLRHRVMMGMLRQTLLRRPAASLTEEDRLLLETYGKEADFTDLSAPVSYTHLDVYKRQSHYSGFCMYSYRSLYAPAAAVADQVEQEKEALSELM